jgi:putative ABC transport system ATP-binding protein
VAAGRALVGRPAVLFADEPTGNLDSRAGTEVLRLLRRWVDEHGQTVLLVTHDPGAIEYADRVLVLVDGELREDRPGRYATGPAGQAVRT